MCIHIYIYIGECLSHCWGSSVGSERDAALGDRVTGTPDPPAPRHQLHHQCEGLPGNPFVPSPTKYLGASRLI